MHNSAGSSGTTFVYTSPETEILVEKSKNSSKVKTHIAFILDESGSMVSLKNTVIEEFNSRLSDLKEGVKNKDQTFISLVTFGNSRIKKAVIETPLAEFEKSLSKKNYVPNGNTPLLDAVGATLERLEEEDGKNQRFMVIIFSDGEENSSKRWNYSSLAAKIKVLKERENWSFVYIGSETDLASMQSGFSLGITSSYPMTYTGRGMARGMSVVTDSLVGYANNVSVTACDYLLKGQELTIKK